MVLMLLYVLSSPMAAGIGIGTPPFTAPPRKLYTG